MLPIVLPSLPSSVLSHTPSLKAKLTLIVLFCHSVCSKKNIIFFYHAITWYKKNTAVNKTYPRRAHDVHLTGEDGVYSSRFEGGKIKNKTQKDKLCSLFSVSKGLRNTEVGTRRA